MHTFIDFWYKNTLSDFFKLKKYFIYLLFFCFFCVVGKGQVIIYEGFDDITTLVPNGWVRTNLSSPLGSTNWFQGNPVNFPAQDGDFTNSYIAANFNNTSGGTGTISNWLITPTLNLKDGDKISFYTRTASGSLWNDRLEVRTSTGAMTVPSGSATNIGSFTNTLLTINPLLNDSYPEVWTEYVVFISGVGTTPTPMNIAFRYYVPNAGPSGLNSNYIGIDTFYVMSPLHDCEEIAVPSNGLENGLIFGGTTSQRLAIDITTGDAGFIMYGIAPTVIDYATDFDFTFYDDNGGIPGSAIASRSGIIFGEEVTGFNFGYNFIKYTVSFDSPVTLDPNTKYWIEIESDALAWEFRTMPYLGNDVFANTNTFGVWTSTGTDELVFDLVCSPLKFIWDGSESTEWDVPANWTLNRVADINGDVFIPNGVPHFPEIDSFDAEAKTIEIDTNARIDIMSNASLTLEGIIINNAPAANFIIESDASLLQINPAENIGHVTVKREATVPSNQYNFWTSPVAGQNMYEIYDFIPPNRVMTYNTWDDYYTIVPNPTNGQFGIGYSIKGPSSGGPGITANFMGTPNNETLSGPNTIPISTQGQGFNLIGNPYPSNLNLKMLYESNTDNLDPSFYFWDNTGNTVMNQQGSGYSGINFAVYNAASNTGTHAADNGDSGKVPNGIVKPGQGFLVQATGGSPIEVNNTMRTIDTKIDPEDGEAPYYKNGSANEIPQEGKFWLELVTPENLHIQIAMGYFMAADSNLDKYDTPAVNENASDNFYSYSNDNVKLTINGKGPFTINDVIPLGITAFEAGTYKIKLDDVRGIFINQNIYLKDKYRGIVHNLSASDYRFKSRNGSYTDRFEIVYVPSHTMEASTQNLITVIRHGNEILVSSSEDKIAEVEIFNLSGRGVYQNSDVADYELRISASRFGKEILILTLVTEAGESFSRKLILN